MKHMRITALILVLVMAMCMAVGCSESASPVITFRETVMDERQYNYRLSTYKGLFLYSYTGGTTDNAQFWATEIASGVTFGDYLEAFAINAMMSNVIMEQLFTENGLYLTDETITSIDTAIDSLVKSAGGKNALDDALSVYGINSKMLREYKLSDARVSAVSEYLYGTNGINSATKDELDAYYKDNYYRVKYILIRKDKEFVRDENGEPILNEKEGYYETRDLTAEEKTAKEALIKDLYTEIVAGGDFDALLKEHTMDMGMLQFADGYYITSQSTFLESDIRDKVKELDINKATQLETDNGWYIVMRCPLEDEAYAVEENAAMFTDFVSSVNTLKMQEYVATFASELVLDEDIMDEYPLAYCTPNFNY